MRILITGGKGQAGFALTKILSRDHQITAPGRDELDVTDLIQVERFVLDISPDLIIHCGALTDVDRCELEPDLAFRVNADGTRNMAAVSLMSGAKLVYISTNFVFDGSKREPYREEDFTSPVNIYGFSKLKGEKFVKDILERYFIVRTSWLYGGGSGNFVKKITALIEKRQKLQIVDDQIATPTFVQDLARAIGKLIKTDLYGTYHITNKGCCSRFEWVAEITKLLELDVELEAVKSDFFSNPARRPESAVLSNRLLKEKTGLELRSWQEALKEHAKP